MLFWFKGFFRAKTGYSDVRVSAESSIRKSANFTAQHKAGFFCGAFAVRTRTFGPTYRV